MSDIYTANGFENRADFKKYVKEISADYGLDFEEVWPMAAALGPSEAYDGLLSTLDDRLAQLEA